MDEDRRIGRYLGIAFLFVWVGSVISGLLWKPILDSPIAEALGDIGESPAQARWSGMIELFITSLGIVVLAVLLYAVVKKQNPLMALVGLGWWIAEAVTLAMSAMAMFLLVPVAESYVESGAASSSHLLSLGDMLANFHNRAYDIHMVFFAFGGFIWYFLMYRSKCVPRWFSVSGLVVVALSLVATVALLAADADLFILAVPTGLFELVFGIWLVIKGASRVEVEPARV